MYQRVTKFNSTHFMPVHADLAIICYGMAIVKNRPVQLNIHSLMLLQVYSMTFWYTQSRGLLLGNPTKALGILPIINHIQSSQKLVCHLCTSTELLRLSKWKKKLSTLQQGIEQSIFRVIFWIRFEIIIKMILKNTIFRKFWLISNSKFW